MKKLFVKLERIPFCRIGKEMYCETVHPKSIWHLCGGTILNKEEAIIVFGRDTSRNLKLRLFIFNKSII